MRQECDDTQQQGLVLRCVSEKVGPSCSSNFWIHRTCAQNMAQKMAAKSSSFGSSIGCSKWSSFRDLCKCLLCVFDGCCFRLNFGDQKLMRFLQTCHSSPAVLCPCNRANRDIPVNFKRVEYPAVTSGMQREQVKPLRATYVKTEVRQNIIQGRQGCCAAERVKQVGEDGVGWAVVPEPSFLSRPSSSFSSSFFFFFGNSRTIFFFFLSFL